MAQRDSGYARIDGDTYVTPRWVYEALWELYPEFEGTPDPFPAGAKHDALESPPPKMFATNPPFNLSDEIVQWALPAQKFALLLPHTWDTAKSRIPFCRLLERKIVLTRRIRWENLKQKANGPSSNHAWYVWGTCLDHTMVWV